MVKKKIFLIFGRIVANYYLRKNKLHVCFKVVFLNSSFYVFRRLSAGFLAVLTGKGHWVLSWKWMKLQWYLAGPEPIQASPGCKGGRDRAEEPRFLNIL